jgi:hypothetical protein
MPCPRTKGPRYLSTAAAAVFGRFRLLAPDGKIVAEGKALPLFSNN